MAFRQGSRSATLASLVLCVGFSGGLSRADEALLRNGRTLPVSDFKLEGDRILLIIAGGGEITLPSDQVIAIRRGVEPPPAPPAPAEPAPPAGAATVLSAPKPLELQAPQVSSEPGAPIEIAPAGVFDRGALRDLAARIARKHQVDEKLVQAVIEVESRYDPFAVSPKGAMGLMQLMPQTAARFAVRNAFNPAENVDGGVRYLKELLGRYSGEVRLALAAYNAGEDAVDQFKGIPPFRETQHYVVKVLKALPR